MRLLRTSLLLLAAALPLAAQDPAGDQPEGPQVVASSDLDVVLSLYKVAHGGAERYDDLRTIAFDYTPSIFDPEGEELRAPVQRISVLFRPDLDEQEQRTVRLEQEVELGEGLGTVKTVSIVTGNDIRVWTEAEDGSWSRSELAELERAAGFHATVLLTNLDLLYWTDSKEIRCRFGGVLRRDGRDYAAVEAEFKPERSVPEPARLYFSGVSSLIERIDAFDPKLRMRIGTVHVEGYEDHGGIKFPGLFRQVDRKGKPIGNWYLDEVSLNGEFEEAFWQKP